MSAFSPRFLEVYDALVQPAVGLVRRVVDLPLQPDEAPLFIAAATCADPLYFQALRPSGTDHYRVVANGAGFTREQCLWSVLGEACERYASGVCFPDELPVATWHDVRDTALPLDQLILFSTEQQAQPGFACTPLDPHAPLRWAHGRRLHDGAPCLVPAFMAWMGYRPQLAGEHFMPQISTGQGAGGSPAQAVLAGLNEVIERDSFTCAWLLQHTRGRFDNAALARHLAPAAARLLALPGLDAFVFDIATDLGVPCHLAMVRSRLHGDIAVGAAAHASARQALSKALVEAHHTRNWTIDLQRQGQTVPPEGIHDFKHHVLHHLAPGNSNGLAFLLDAPEVPFDPGPPESRPTAAEATPPPDDHAHLLRHTVGLLVQAGLAPVYVDTTPADLRSIGISTAKVIVPGLQPLHVGVGTEHRDPRRLRQVAAAWGLSWPRALNPHPHPFP